MQYAGRYEVKLNSMYTTVKSAGSLTLSTHNDDDDDDDDVDDDDNAQIKRTIHTDASC